MKRISAVITALVLLLLAAQTPAYADVVFGTDFSGVKEDKLVPVERRFYANGEDGYVVTKEQINGRKEYQRFENGEIVIVDFAYQHKGNYLGGRRDGHHFNYGWVRMDELLMFYDSIDFEIDHQNELYEYTGDFSRLYGLAGFYYWQWPGADTEKRFFDTEERYFDMEEGASELRALYAYTDHESREWVYLIIGYGEPGGGMALSYWSEGWVCMDDPANSGIPAFNPAPVPVLWSPDGPPDWSGANTGQQSQQEQQPSAQSENPNMIPVIIVIAGGAAALIFVFIYRKSKRA